MDSPKITAQIADGEEAYLAMMREFDAPGPTGETSIAEIWHTSNRGRTWHKLPWRRALRDFISRAAFAHWPPEWVNRMRLDNGELEIDVFEDGGFESRRDPIWRARWDGARWHVRFCRAYRTENDGSIVPASLELDLPGIHRPPVLGPFRSADEP